MQMYVLVGKMGKNRKYLQVVPLLSNYYDSSLAPEHKVGAKFFIMNQAVLHI